MGEFSVSHAGNCLQDQCFLPVIVSMEI